jgi:hypothetical protein
MGKTYPVASYKRELMKGWIALDIDGTITDDIHTVPEPVSAYLASLASDGWGIIFITGRMFHFAHNTLKTLTFPYYLALQNGADILRMPDQKLLLRNYLKIDTVLHLLEAIYREEEEDYLIYAGYERGDFCYWRPSRFSGEMRAFLQRLQKLTPQPWQAVEHFTFDANASFPLIKCLGSKEAMEKIEAKLLSHQGIATTLIKEPSKENLYLILITDHRATKGRALEQILKGQPRGELIIAAGDDLNDLSMLQIADVSIAMASSPPRLMQEADIIASHASERGIIEALKKAIVL